MPLPYSRSQRREIAKRYLRMCKTDLAHKESRKKGRTRRGRKKDKVILFPFPKRGKHHKL